MIFGAERGLVLRFFKRCMAIVDQKMRSEAVVCIVVRRGQLPPDVGRTVLSDEHIEITVAIDITGGDDAPFFDLQKIETGALSVPGDEWRCCERRRAASGIKHDHLARWPELANAKVVGFAVSVEVSDDAGVLE